jgi:Flp pilus assembly pilin Flp
MNWRTRTVARIRGLDGQTMTEYALILATIAAVVVSLYHTSGTIVQGLISGIDNSL